MGWLTYNLAPGVTRKQECDRICTHDGEQRASRVIDSAMVGTTYYAAIENTDKVKRKTYVFAAVFLTSGGNKFDRNNFGYKDMDEGMGCHESAVWHHARALYAKTGTFAAEIEAEAAT